MGVSVSPSSQVCGTRTTAMMNLLPFRRFSVVLFTLSLGAGAIALPHSGGTDRCGGHTNRKTGVYHVHNQAKARACQPDSKSSESAPGMPSAESAKNML